MTEQIKQPDTKQIPRLAADNMGKAILELVLQELRAAPDMWSRMSQKQQNETIDRARQSVQWAIAGAVNTITTQDQVSLGAVVDSLTIKDKIKLVLQVSRCNETETLNDLYQLGSGANVRVLLSNAEPYIGGMDLVVAEPDQRELFAQPTIPDDDLLWAVNLPMMSGSDGLFPAPDRHQAELYARAIRERLLDKDTEFSKDCAKHVFALPWIFNQGEHTRSIQDGKWEALVNWYVKLKNGELDIEPQEPIALIEHSPEDVIEVVPESEVIDAKFDYIRYFRVFQIDNFRFEARSVIDVDFNEVVESAPTEELAISMLLMHFDRNHSEPNLIDEYIDEDGKVITSYEVGFSNEVVSEEVGEDFEIIVKKAPDTNTAKAMGVRTSSTSSPIQAAINMLHKLNIKLGTRCLFVKEESEKEVKYIIVG